MLCNLPTINLLYFCYRTEIVNSIIISLQMNLFLFHRDLRLIDNTSLIKQLKIHKKVTPIFIFPPSQINPAVNKYFSHNSVQFMVESLNELTLSIKQMGGTMYFFKGDNLEVLKDISSKFKINSIGFNLDYTPFAKQRDKQIIDWAEQCKIQLICQQDYGLYPMLKGELLNSKTQKPYLVFTPFRNFCMKTHSVRKPDLFSGFVFEANQNLSEIPSNYPCAKLDALFQKNEDIISHGGRQHGLKILDEIKKFKNYNKTRNNPSLPTTKLSPHLHFTTVSIREVYHRVVDDLGIDNNIINQIHWRQFYMYITNYFPKVLQGKSFQQKFDKIKWNYNEKWMEAWKNGETGFPIVDAAMRQLNQTGWMHNRCRMIVASFLAKDLFLDWHEGQKYFANKLVDYSPMQNSGGWQWTVGNGTDAAPYFRIFNPWSQQKNFDEECIYIKKWIPELQKVATKDIHNWSTEHDTYRKKGVKYPAPIIEHDYARKQTLQSYTKYFAKQ